MDYPVRICVTICSTESYTYAMKSQCRKVVSAIQNVKRGKLKDGVVCLVGDKSKNLEEMEQFYKDNLPFGWSVVRFPGDYQEFPNYGPDAQKTIACMRSVAFSYARKHDFDLCWSLDSDVLPPHNALSCSLQMLEFDDGYYGVVCCPYPSQGGGDFLAGRGSEQSPILPDVYDDERLLTDDVLKEMESFKADLQSGTYEGKQEEFTKRNKLLRDLISKCPPKGDVFFLNSMTSDGIGNPRGTWMFAKLILEHYKSVYPSEDSQQAKFLELFEKEKKRWESIGFRRRGWISAAYPGIGVGAILPIEWFGFGSNLMSKKALSLAQFEGYGGDGTEDVYIIRNKWIPNGILLCVITHCPCSHVIRETDHKTGEIKYLLVEAYHETKEGECKGHLRKRVRPWFQHVEGELNVTSSKTK
jgi:hypothetical protein